MSTEMSVSITAPPILCVVCTIPALLSMLTALMSCALIGLTWSGYIPWQSLVPIDRRPLSTSDRPWSLPPGPRDEPILGYLRIFFRDLKAEPKQTLDKLAADYGEMTTLHLGAKTWILLNSDRVSREIIVKRGSITTERAYLPVTSGIVSRGLRTLVQQYDKWLDNRRIMHHLFTGSAMRRYEEYKHLASTRMMLCYVQRPRHWSLHNHHFACSTIHHMVLGTEYTATLADLAELDQTVNDFTDSLLGSWIDWFPALARLPQFLQLWRPRWEAMDRFHNSVYHKWFDPTAAAIRNGTCRPCWVRDILLNPAFGYKGDEEEAMYCAIQLIEGGTATTKASINSFVMAMALFPQTLSMLRHEVDQLCDTNEDLRSPTLADVDRLPYTSAVVKEVLRWRPMLLTPEHTLSRDLDFEGYHIPAGVSFVVNGWAVANACERPTEFEPSRWLDGNEQNILSGIWQFGGGRRVCPAFKFSQRSLMLCFARLAQVFDFVLDEERMVIYRMDKSASDEDFPVIIKVRDERHRDLLVHDAVALGLLRV